MNGLSGRQVLVTRPRADDDPLVQALGAHGAIPVSFPTIAIRPVDDLRQVDAAIRRLGDYAWIVFTSANAVEVFLDRLARVGQNVPDGVAIAAVGTATAKVLEARGLAVDFIPSQYRGATLGVELPNVAGRRVLLPRAAIARDDLASILTDRGATVDDLPVYDTVPAEPDPEGLARLERGEIDAVTFTSASTVRNLFTLVGARAPHLLRDVVVACIGPVTAEEARAHGLAVDVLPGEYTVQGLADALDEHLARAAARSGSR